MTSPSITMTYRGPDATEALALLLIEQEAWKPYTGVVTKGAMVAYLATMLYGDAYDRQIDCGLTGDSVVCALFVYPRIHGLAYQLHASHGTLSERVVETIEEVETINYSLAASVTPHHPPLRIRRAVWVDEVYDSEGVVVDPPQLTVADGAIIAPLAVYGAVEVAYTTERHSYLLTAPRRDDDAAIDNYYTACVYGLYDGGLAYLQIEMPPTIDAINADPDAVCGWGAVQGAITAPDEDTLPVAPLSVDRETVVDYCSRQVASDVYYSR